MRVTRWDHELPVKDKTTSFDGKNKTHVKRGHLDHVVTTFMITVNTNKIPLGYEDKLDQRVRNQRFRRGNTSSEFTEDSFSRYLSYKLRLMFEDVVNIKNYLSFWPTSIDTDKVAARAKKDGQYPPFDYATNKESYMHPNKYTWDNYPDNDVGIVDKPRLIQDVTIFVAPEIGPKYHKLHAHIMLEVKHVGNIKVNVNPIITRMKDDVLKSVWVSSIKHYWNGVGDPRAQMFDYIRKTKSDTITNPYETKIDRYEQPDRYSDLIVNRRPHHWDKNYGFHLIELMSDQIEPELEDVGRLFEEDEYAWDPSSYTADDVSRNLGGDGNYTLGYGRASQFYPDWNTFPR